MAILSAPTILCEVEIKGRMYGVEPIDPGEDGSAAYVLHKPNGDSYAVLKRHDGIIACDCPHYVARLDGVSISPCKHGQALVDLGFLAPPATFDATPTVPLAGRTTNLRAARLAEEPRQTPQEPRQSLLAAEVEKTPDGGRPACCEPTEPAPCVACAPSFAEELAEAVGPVEPSPDDADWEDRWSSGPEPTHDLAGWLDAQAERYELLDTEAGDHLRDHIRALASMVRFVKASHPATAMDRIASLDRYEAMTI